MGALAPASYIVFGSRLLQQLLRWKEENVLVSPASVGFALSMAAAAGGHESIDLRVLYRAPGHSSSQMRARRYRVNSNTVITGAGPPAFMLPPEDCHVV